MQHENDFLREKLQTVKTVAVVGISDKPERSSNEVARYLTRHYRVIPVNPNLRKWNGQPCYPSLLQIPKEITIDVVDIFRRGELVLPIVEDAIQRKVGLIWMQQGVINEEAAAMAEKHGIPTVMDSCLAVVHRSLLS